VSRILVLRALGLGDLLVAVPALRALRAAHPAARITLAAPEPLRELAFLTGAVDELLPTPGLGELDWPYGRPDLAVNLHGHGPESILDLRAIRPAELLTHRHPDFPGLDGPRWIQKLHETERWCRLMEFVGLAADPGDLALPVPRRESPAIGSVVLHPGAAHPARRWPPERFAEVARGLAGQRVAVTGNLAEIGIARQVAELAGLEPETVLAGRTDLTELAAIVAGAPLVVCGDTGVGHLATAFGTPSVLLFGPTPPSLWGPPDRPRHAVLWSGMVRDPFGDAPDPGLLRISPGQVLEAANRVMAVASVGHG
jgi:ADP-heptose:LPS heptosyltransferase